MTGPASRQAPRTPSDDSRIDAPPRARSAPLPSPSQRNAIIAVRPAPIPALGRQGTVRVNDGGQRSTRPRGDHGGATAVAPSIPPNSSSHLAPRRALCLGRILHDGVSLIPCNGHASSADAPAIETLGLNLVPGARDAPKTTGNVLAQCPTASMVKAARTSSSTRITHMCVYASRRKPSSQPGRSVDHTDVALQK